MQSRSLFKSTPRGDWNQGFIDQRNKFAFALLRRDKSAVALGYGATRRRDEPLRQVPGCEVAGFQLACPP